MSDGGRYRLGRRWPGRRLSALTLTAGLVLIVGAGLAFAGGAAAKAKHHRLRCRPGYVRRTVRIPERRHGHIVRRHHKVVYIRRERCVRRHKKKAPGVTKPTTTTTTKTSPTTTSPSSPGTPTGPPAPPPAPSPPPTHAVAVAVGDIACPPGAATTTSNCQQAATATLAQSFNPADVFVLGDNQYDNGTTSEYQGAYAPTWGVFNPIVHPVPGNHEYGTTGAAGYFSYFTQEGVNVGNPYGYYSFNVGSWHIIALNSNCSNSDVGKSGCPDAIDGNTTSAQTSWLQSDLAADHSACTLAMWHHPLFSDGWTGGSKGVQPLFAALYNAHADIVLNGHDHLYERYGQLDPSGTGSTSGIREFVVGTGGESLNGIGGVGLTPQVSARQFGVLVLTLQTSSYTWEFLNASNTVVDSGTTACHGPGATAAVAGVAHVARSATNARLAGPPLAFDFHPLRGSVRSMMRFGVPVAVYSDRGVDVTVTVWLRRGGHLRRIASAYETESQISKPYSRIRLRVPARWLKHSAGGSLVMRFAAVDAAQHHKTLTRTVRLP